MVDATTQSRAAGRQVARSLGEQAAIYGYPMVEMLRMCRLQTRARFDLSGFDQVPIDVLRHTRVPPLDREAAFPIERDRVLYSTGWINLSEGARHLAIARLIDRDDAPATVALHDAYGERFLRVAQSASTQRIVLTGPHADVPRASQAARTVSCPTTLVWLVGRSAFRPGRPSEPLRVASMLKLDGPAGTLNGLRPAAVEMWEGAEIDAFSDIVDRALPARDTAPAFYANFCRALAHNAGRPEDRPLLTRLRQLELGPSEALDWNRLDLQVREGLIEGLERAALIVSGMAASTRHPDAQPSPGADEYLARAVAVRSGAAFRQP